VLSSRDWSSDVCSSDLLLFLGKTRDLRYRSPQTDFHPAAAIAHSRLLKQSGDAKKNGEN